MLINSNKKLYNNQINYFLVFCYWCLNAYIEGFLVKSKVLLLFINYLNLFTILSFIKYNLILVCDSLIDIVVVDHLKRKSNRFEINYILWNYTFELRFIIKVYLKEFTSVISTTLLYKSGNWLEREVWDMYGINFILHPI